MKGEPDKVAEKAKTGGPKAKPETKAGARKAPARKTVAKKKAAAVVAPAPEKLKSRKAETLKLEKKKPAKKPVSKKVAKKKAPARRARPSKPAEASAPPGKPGRPTLFTDELLEKICGGLAEGTPLSIICKPEEMPTPRTVQRWMKDDEEVLSHIAGAREAGFDEIAAQVLTIADNIGHKEKDTIATDFGEIPNKEWMMRSRLRCEMRLKLLSKWDPKRYGDKVTTEVSGPGGGAVPIAAVAELSEDQERRIVEAAAIAAGLVAPACMAAGAGAQEAVDESPDEE